MKDLRLYTEEEIYKMLESGYITIDDLDEYIKDGTISAEAIEVYLKDGLIDIKDIEPYIKTNQITTRNLATYINMGAISVEDIKEYIKTGVVDADELSAQTVDNNDSAKIETIKEESENIHSDPESPEETIEITPPQEEKTQVVETPESNEEQEKEEEQELAEVKEDDSIEKPESIMPEDYAPVAFDEDDINYYNEAKFTMEQTYNYSIYAGMKVKDMSIDGKDGRGPYISFEINNESKQILDHLMLELYANSDGVALEFLRSMATKEEIFTIELNNANMGQDEFYHHVRDTFLKIYETIQTTRNDLDYANMMPEGLKDIKERFRNDDPDIGQDFTIGYVRNDGKDSYYIVADNSAKALEYARSIGYDVKNRQGANVFEIETNGNVIDTKLDGASIDLAKDEAVMDITKNGVSNLDVYGSVEQDPRVELIEHFIETSNDPHLFCILDIEIPVNNPTQRVVTMKSEMGGSETVVFPNGDNFDQQVMPRIIDTYAENNPIYQDNISKNAPDAIDRASCMVESENNTVLRINGYSDAETNQIVETISSKEKSSSQNMEMTNAKQKSLGTYPTNNNQTEHDAAFVSMPILFAVCILCILVLSFIIFTG